MTAQSQDSPPSSFLSGANDKVSSTSTGGLRREPAAALGHELRGRLRLEPVHNEQRFLELQPAAGGESRLDGRPAAAARPPDRQCALPAARLAEEPRDRRRGPAADDCTDAARREERVLGLQVRAGVARRRSPVVRPRSRIAPQHAHARRDRHARSDRRHRGGGGGRAARGGGHSRRGVHRADGGSASLAGVRSQHAGVLEHASRADRPGAVPGAGGGRERRDPAGPRRTHRPGRIEEVD